MHVINLKRFSEEQDAKALT